MKTNLSPNWIRGLGFALIFAWTSASLAQNEARRPTNTPDPAASASSTTLSPPTTKAPAPKPGSPALLPFAFSPAITPLAAYPLDRDGLPANLRFSYWTTEVIKLARAGIDDDVLLPFIDSVGTFNLNADEIIYLSDIGVSRQVMASMIQHDFEVAAGLRLVTASASPSSMLFPFAAGSESTADAGKQPANAPSPATPANSSIPANATAPAIGADTVITDRGDIMSDLAAFDFGTTDQAPPSPSQAPAPRQARSVPTRTSTLYAVRQPYAEAVTPPIIIVPGVDRTPNVVLIRFNP
jgi:hypothetical protein